MVQKYETIAQKHPVLTVLSKLRVVACREHLPVSVTLSLRHSFEIHQETVWSEQQTTQGETIR
jgi:hypothetical protein